MTVHRVGSDLQAPHRVDLGHLLVTIDDIAALMTLLTLPDGPKPSVEFIGGYFTEAKELRTLSDEEMKRLALKTPTVQVVLESSFAVAFGERSEVEDVYRLWARTRQAPAKPQLLTNRIYQASLALATIGVASLGLCADILYLHQVGPGGYILLLYIAIIGLGTIIMALVLARSHKWYWNESSHAIVVPMSREQHRQQLSTEKYPRRSWIVAIISAIIAAISVAALVWIKITSK